MVIRQLKISMGLLLGILLCLQVKHNNAATGNDNIMFLFSHGIADNHTQAYKYARYYPKQPTISHELYIDPTFTYAQHEYTYNNQYIITSPFFTFDYPDATIRFYKSSLAQSVDIERLSDVFYRALKTYNKDIILFGVSRGASTIINFMGQKDPDSICALILESPFDAMETIVEYKIKRAWLHKIPGIKQLSHALVSAIFMKYHMNGIRPIDSALNIPKHTPILFICSQEDTLVPAQSTIALYKTLRHNNYPYVHLLIVPQGRHARIINDSYGNLYQNVVHAFLRAYQLPHDPVKAGVGQHYFLQTQPAVAELV